MSFFWWCLAVKKIEEENIAFGVLSLLFDNFNFFHICILY